LRLRKVALNFEGLVTRQNVWKWIDRLWLLGLATYILAGVPLATYHGDETATIIASRDLDIQQVEKLPAMLAIRASWAFGFFDVNNPEFHALREPWHPDETYEQNAYAGRVADEPILYGARYGTAALLALSAAVLFMLGRLYGGRPAAYIASTLYALHPLILLNSRRALEDSALLLFILLAVWGMAWIMKQGENRRTFGSDVAPTYALIAVLAAIALLGTMALVGAHPSQNLPLSERAGILLTAPFQTPLQHMTGYGYVESLYWSAQQAAYDVSLLRGLSFEGLFGLVLTGLMLVGVIANFMPRYRLHQSRSLSFLMLGWTGITALLVILFPSEDARAVEPLIPLAALLVALGVVGLLQDVVDPLRTRYRDKSPREVLAAIERDVQSTVTGISPRIRKLRRVLTVGWLLGLGVYIALGVPLASYHGDETTYMFASRDFDTLFLQGQPQALLVTWLSENKRSYERLMNGSVYPYSLGLSWWLAGYTVDNMPSSNWMWGNSFDINIAMGIVASGRLLDITRAPSALFLWLSVVILFALAERFGGRAFAFLTSGLYALNPVVLLAGRRALPEGALLCFGLLTIALGVAIADRRRRKQPVRWRWWALALAGALALGSKQTALIYIAAAYGWIIIGDLLTFHPQTVLKALLGIIGSGLVMVALTFAISPGLWYDPLTRLQELVVERQKLIAVQVDFDPNAPTTFAQRMEDLIAQPFLRPPMHYELPGFAESPALGAQIARYMASPLSGVQFGALLGGLLTLFTLLGLIAARLPRWQLLGLYLWLALNIVPLLLNPLPWQRYYLPIIPPVTLFCALGVWWLVRAVTAPRVAPNLIQSPENA
jgi:4-amino-4-deoxy-L-arabinose transferase-like glycosyltransferase